jgi:hypothetical protein
MRALSFFSLIAATAAACGSGPATFNGTVRGQGFKPADALSSTSTVTLSDGSTVTVGEVALSSVHGMCNLITSAQTPKSSQYFIMLLAAIQNGVPQPPSGPGTFTVSTATSGNIATVSFQALDQSCASINANSADGVAGTVTLTSVNNGAYNGNFDVSLSSGDHVSGSFTASSCPQLGASLNSNRQTTCI